MIDGWLIHNHIKFAVISRHHEGRIIINSKCTGDNVRFCKERCYLTYFDLGSRPILNTSRSQMGNIPAMSISMVEPWSCQTRATYVEKDYRFDYRPSVGKLLESLPQEKAPIHRDPSL